ncbi:MAG TPA: hypothetical protein VGL83_08075 [Stellaceae bacterium]|jgi:hypothetical protein
MSANGLVAVDVAIASPAAGTFQSGAENDQALSYNPAFLVGSGTLTSAPTANPSAPFSADPYASTSAPATAAVGTPVSATPALTTSAPFSLPSLSSINPEIFWLGAGLLVLVLLLPSGKKR